MATRFVAVVPTATLRDAKVFRDARHFGDRGRFALPPVRPVDRGDRPRSPKWFKSLVLFLAPTEAAAISVPRPETPRIEIDL
jgi:hypothetical protein